MGPYGVSEGGRKAMGAAFVLIMLASPIHAPVARAVAPGAATPKAPTAARATANGTASRTAGTPSSVSGEETYRNAVEEFTRSYAKGVRPPLVANSFSRLDWVQRTALLNVVCAADGSPRCLDAVELGLTDGALVVRDHAFRILLALPVAEEARRAAAAEGILADDRNYRKGQGLWIVERARKYLEVRRK